jgi:hypothetical protein
LPQNGCIKLYSDKLGLVKSSDKLGYGKVLNMNLLMFF